MNELLQVHGKCRCEQYSPQGLQRHLSGRNIRSNRFLFEFIEQRHGWPIIYVVSYKLFNDHFVKQLLKYLSVTSGFATGQVKLLLPVVHGTT